MSRDQQELEYLKRREATSLKMAADADQPQAAKIHRRMAKHYAAGAAAIESADAPRAG